jgi:hypothetical protein
MSQIFLILAHKNPRQLERLVNRLTDPDSKFVIHIDADCDKEKFLFFFKDRVHDVFFLPNAIATKWGSFELVKATLLGLQFINDHIPNAERVTLLSGQDYPIKPVKQIISFFTQNQKKIYIEYFSIPCKHWWKGGTKRFPLFESIIQMIEIYAGSQWWSMPMMVIKNILSGLSKYPDFTLYFERVFIPDESFFQTLLLNSEEDEIKNNLVNDSLRFILWYPPFWNPSTFVQKDLRKLSRSNKLFARKFDEEVDKSILDKIDDVLLNFKNARNFKKQTRSSAKSFTEAVLLLTNKTASIEKFNNLRNSLDKYLYPYLLFHETGLNTANTPEVKLIFKFDNSILSSLGFKPIAAELLPGSNHFPLFSFFHSHPDYDYYWVIEDDVVYNANWNDFFHAFNSKKINAAFISSKIRTHIKDPTWHWWDTLKNEKNDETAVRIKLASFNPVYRISKEAIKYLENKMKEGWMGHHETLIPTLLYNAGFPILDFGGDGDFCLFNNRNRFYKVNQCTLHDRKHHSSMRYRPFVDLAEISENLLYHPVKFD